MSVNDAPLKHVAIIMDGNGRFAKKQGLPRVAGHKKGASVAKDIVAYAAEIGIGVLSLFTFSSENWFRPKGEVSFLMDLFIRSLKKELNALTKNNIRITFTGNRAGLSEAVLKVMDDAMVKTATNSGLVLNIVFNYGGKWDIVSACQKIAKQCLNDDLSVNDIDEKVFEKALCMSDLPAPELFIRTSGEYRISNFFLWQLAYTELYFTDVFWPEFSVNEFDKALDWYRARERRFGLTSEQVG